ncbi:hypothetical protein FT641_19255 [Bacillus paranthracis]|uniref:hypothetical protein n=1 Tax=Bacillus paranthracis TaxID=2026186 RepID=UPI00187ADB72|nr:hypothetical protein [Bacillus paranthracis]MBE7114296.1 hypothetical protein [Bacillus paranthracis]MBE7154831.1 hypothetical protein [Bacillus paranthracis]
MVNLSRGFAGRVTRRGKRLATPSQKDKILREVTSRGKSTCLGRDGFGVVWVKMNLAAISRLDDREE